MSHEPFRAVLRLVEASGKPPRPTKADRLQWIESALHSALFALRQDRPAEALVYLDDARRMIDLTWRPVT